jgi:acetyl esterase/lipase
MGASSGGNTLMLSALRPTDPRYADEPVLGGEREDASLAYVVLCWSVLDAFARYQFAVATSYERIVESTRAYFRDEEQMREGSPTLLVARGEATSLPPALIIQGTADGNIPMHLPEGFVEAYRQAGGEVDMVVFPDMPHRFMFEAGPETERGVAAVKAFLARQGSLRCT